MESQLSPIVRIPINLVQRLICPGLIKDPWIMPLCPKTSKMSKEQERKVCGAGVLDSSASRESVVVHKLGPSSDASLSS